MAKSRDPGLADFAVHLYGYEPLKIRATSLIVVDQWLYLRDAGLNILFAAPQMNILHVKRLEPGEAMAAPERLPESEPVDPMSYSSATFGGFAQVDPVGQDGGPVGLAVGGDEISGATDPRCTAPNATGRRCKLDAVPGTNRCSIHPLDAA